MEYQGNEIRLGNIVGTDRELVMSAEDRQTHLYLPGNTGVGKSKMLESMICQDIDQHMESGCGLMLIDPHGSVYRNVLKYVAESGIDRPIIPLDFSRNDWILGYNPLRDRHGGDPSVIVKILVAAIAHVFGERNTEGTPRFGRVGTSVLYALLQDHRTFLEAPHLLSNKSALAVFAGSVKEHFARTDLRRTASLSDRDFFTEIESTLSRLRPFCQNQRFKAMFGHVGETLDLRKVLDDGAIVLVNLEQSENLLSDEDAALFGTLLLTDLWISARDRGKPDDASLIKPFYVYIDECQNFVTPTIARSLAEARGYGLNVVMANQYPGQFLDAGENGEAMRRAVMATARSKAVFQMDALDDLEDLAKLIFAGLIDPMKVKHWTTKVVGHERQATVSRTTGTSSQRGGSRGTNSNVVSGTSQRVREGGEDEWPVTASEHSGEGNARGDSWSETEIDTTTVGEMLVPILGQEVGQYMSIDEQLAAFKQIVNGQEKRHCMIRLASMKTPAAIRTLDVPPAWIDSTDLDAYIVSRFRSLPFALPLAEGIEAATKREAEFLESIFRSHEAFEPKTAAKRIRKKVASVIVDSKTGKGNPT